jgi:polyhydroxybutyrate depolymerase
MSRDDEGFSLVNFAHAGETRPYYLYVPAAVRAAAAPLLLELHGRGINSLMFDRMTGFHATAGQHGFVLVLPTAIDETWNDGRDPRGQARDDISYLLAVIEDVQKRTPVDEQRVYAAGMSNGATMTGRLACEHPAPLAAIAQVAGTAAAAIVEGARVSRPVPIINFHGAADRYAPYTGGNRHGLRARILVRRAWRPAIGVDDWARFWIAANRAINGPQLHVLPPDTSARTWHGDTPSSDITFYRIDRGGHTWPGSSIPLPRLLMGRTSHTINATSLIWNFLSSHTRDN